MQNSLLMLRNYDKIAYPGGNDALDVVEGLSEVASNDKHLIFVCSNGLRQYSIVLDRHTNGDDFWYQAEVTAHPNKWEVDNNGNPTDDFIPWSHESTVPFFTAQSAFMYACNIVWDQSTVRTG